MKKFQPKFRRAWQVIGQTSLSQAAQMVIPPGDSEGGPGNRHQSDQWLFVISGTGQARLGRWRVALTEGVLLLIEKGEEHEIRNTGDEPLRTLNFYAPPAY